MPSVPPPLPLPWLLGLAWVAWWANARLAVRIAAVSIALLLPVDLPYSPAWSAWWSRTAPRLDVAPERVRLWLSGPEWRKRRRFYWRNRLVTEKVKAVKYAWLWQRHGIRPAMGGATIVAAAGGGNWSAGGSWVGGVAPGPSDNVQLASTSGNITVTSGAACRSLDSTGYTGTLNAAGGIALAVGDATAGTGNIAVKLVAGMTLNANLLFNFVASPSATQQTVDFAGKTTNTLDFGTGASGGSWKLTGSVTVVPLIRHTRGTLDLNGQTVTCSAVNVSGSNTRTLNMGSGTWTLTGTGTVWNAAATGLTLNAGTSTIVVSDTSATGKTFTGAGKAYANLNLLRPETVTITADGSTFTSTGHPQVAGKLPQPRPRTAIVRAGNY